MIKIYTKNEIGDFIKCCNCETVMVTDVGYDGECPICNRNDCYMWFNKEQQEVYVNDINIINLKLDYLIFEFGFDIYVTKKDNKPFFLFKNDTNKYDFDRQMKEHIKPNIFNSGTERDYDICNFCEKVIDKHKDKYYHGKEETVCYECLDGFDIISLKRL